VLCKEKHPANYKGCSVYKELQEKHFPALRRKEPRLNNDEQPSSSRTIPGMTYSAAARYAEPQPNTQPGQDAQTTSNTLQSTFSADIIELKGMIKTLVQQMSTMLNLLTTLISKQK